MIKKQLDTELAGRISELLFEERKETAKEIFDKIEKEFNVTHGCACEEWCKCWDEFKAKYLQESKRKMIVKCKHCGKRKTEPQPDIVANICCNDIMLQEVQEK